MFTRIVIGVAVLSLAPSATAESRLARERSWAESAGQVAPLPADLSASLGLTDGKTGYVIKGLEWGDDNDNSTHWFELSSQDEAHIILAYSPADKSYAINWLTDIDGRLYRTVYGDKTGLKVVPNEKFAAKFASEIGYWDATTHHCRETVDLNGFPPKDCIAP
jgi:hypothetical protein